MAEVKTKNESTMQPILIFFGHTKASSFGMYRRML